MEDYIVDTFDSAFRQSNITIFNELYKELINTKTIKITEQDKLQLLSAAVVKSDSLEFMEYLLKLNLCDIENLRDPENNSFLHYAAVTPEPQVLKYVLKNYKFFINEIGNNELTPLGYAALSADNPENLDILIKAGADINCHAKCGENLLIMASGNSNLDVIKYVHNLGFDINSTDNDGYTPLLQAAFHQENKEVFQYFIEKGANINAKTKNGETLFHLAARNPSPAIVRFVSSAFHTGTQAKNGTTCMEQALMDSTSPDVLRIYLNKQKIENLFMACFNQNPYILESMFENGYEINCHNEYNVTPFMFACQVNSNPEVLKMFLANEAYTYLLDDEGRNILHFAAVNKNPQIFQFLRENVDFNALNVEDKRNHHPEYYIENPEEF